MAGQDIFNSKVVPVMNKVHDQLCSKRADELRQQSTSIAGIGSMLSDPYGMVSSMDTVRITGNWNTKTVEDYVSMVKKELKKQGVTVTKDLEKKMVDKMVKDKIPKSSIDYILKKAASQTLFYIPTEVKKSQLERTIDEKSEQAYKPKLWEKGFAWGLSTATDVATTGGLGGGWKTAAKLATGDAVADIAIPLVIAPGKEKEYLADQKAMKQAEQKPQKKEEAKADTPQEETTEEEQKPEQSEEQQENNQQTSGWDELVKTLGMEGISDVANNLGYILAMLPDMIVGLFTGKTKSIDLKEDMVPLASLVGGMFVKNPLLKTMMMGYGGANLLNKMGHEALDRANASDMEKQRGYVAAQDGNRYKVYPDEELNPRVTRPTISGNRLVCNIDGVPCNVQLNDSIVQAYNSGSLPMNTLVNAIIAKNDKMQQVVTDNYSEHQSQAISRSRGV